MAPAGPKYECDGCGACCRTFPIFASLADARREPSIAGAGRALPACHATSDWAVQLFPLPFLDACTFLDSANRCTIYATRPDVCRHFLAGADQCQEARVRQGLPPLAALSDPDLAPTTRSS